jgi:hypothetical protein
MNRDNAVGDRLEAVLAMPDLSLCPKTSHEIFLVFRAKM